MQGLRNSRMVLWRHEVNVLLAGRPRGGCNCDVTLKLCRSPGAPSVLGTASCSVGSCSGHTESITTASQPEGRGKRKVFSLRHICRSTRDAKIFSILPNGGALFG